MAAHEAINSQQLQLFYTGTELQSMITGSGDVRTNLGETLEGMWDRKTKESQQPMGTGHGAGVYDSIKERGYVGGRLGVVFDRDLKSGNPVTRIPEGHHRVAAAADIERSTGKLTFIPVLHYDADKEDYPLDSTVSAWESAKEGLRRPPPPPRPMGSSTGRAKQQWGRG